MPERYRLRQRICVAQHLFDFVVDILRHKGRCPASVAEAPDADPVRIHVRVAADYVIDRRDASALWPGPLRDQLPVDSPTPR